MKPGIYPDISIEDYHKAPGLSSSCLPHLDKSPAHLQAYLNTERVQTDSQLLGMLVHMRTLERELFEKKVVCIAGHRGGTDVKALVNLAKLEGKIPCKPDQYEKVCRMSDKIIQHPWIVERRLLDGGVAEHSIFWEEDIVLDLDHPEVTTQILLKCRPDYLKAEQGVVVDLKTYDDLRPASLQRQIHAMNYHKQQAFYLRGVSTILKKQVRLFANVFVEVPDDPMDEVGVRVVLLDDASIEKASFEIEALLRLYAQCKTASRWPGYPSEPLVTSLPTWAW